MLNIKRKYEANEYLLSKIPEHQFKKVFEQENSDIDYDFLGFTDIYDHLSRIIPKHFTVIDFGCAYAPQCFYFEDHKRYIGVDYFVKERFEARNTEHILASIYDILYHIDYTKLRLDENETFAICSYVPNQSELVRQNFKNCFCFYPSNKKETQSMWNRLLKRE